MQPHEAEQFAALWTAAQPTISAFIRTLIRDFQQADEVLQRVAVTLVRKFDQYDPSRPFGAWAIGVAKYEVLYFRRERATDKHLSVRVAQVHALSFDVNSGDVAPMNFEQGKSMPF
jgi:RNA polymerase sigma-70 factor (ECF subfamily)